MNEHAINNWRAWLKSKTQQHTAIDELCDLALAGLKQEKLTEDEVNRRAAQVIRQAADFVHSDESGSNSE